MTKHFCDKCGRELPDVDQPNEGEITFAGVFAEIKIKGQEVKGVFEIHQRQDSGGEFCRGCVFDAIQSLDTRDRPGLG